LAVQSVARAAVFNHVMEDDPYPTEDDQEIMGPRFRESVDLFEEFFGYAYRRPAVEQATAFRPFDEQPSVDEIVPDTTPTSATAEQDVAADTEPTSVMSNVPLYQRPPPPPPAPRIGSIFVQPGGPPPGWRHPAADRRPPEPDPLLEEFGYYVRRARYLELLSQQHLADETGLPQSQISRLERGFAPGLGLSGLLCLGQGIGRALPLGCCPHDHTCVWQPIKPTPVHRLGR
jgi:hypothetical protein